MDMPSLRPLVKKVAIPILHPLRGPVTWACQRGFLSSGTRRFFPWRWVTEPFTVYGDSWTCRWCPTEFDTVGHRIFWSGFREWEKETVPVMLDNLRRARTFIDIGANCGIYTVLGCTVNPKLRAISVEPVPNIFAALSNNIAQNDLASRVQVLNIALGDSNGKVSFHEADDPTMGSLAKEGYRGQSGRIIEVDCKTLDSLVQELRVEPDFLKIDVEGFEDAVLRGATTVLRRFQPRIILEANPGDPAHLVNSVLSAHGYSFYSITASGPEKQPAISPVNEYRNWLCVPSGSV